MEAAIQKSARCVVTLVSSASQRSQRAHNIAARAFDRAQRNRGSVDRFAWHSLAAIRRHRDAERSTRGLGRRMPLATGEDEQERQIFEMHSYHEDMRPLNGI